MSARHPDGDMSLISRSRCPALVTPDDILTTSLDGKVLVVVDEDIDSADPVEVVSAS